MSMSAKTAGLPRKRKAAIYSPVKKRKWKNADLLLLLVPAVIQVLLFRYWPVAGIQIAFKNFSARKGIWGSEWVGLKHGPNDVSPVTHAVNWHMNVSAFNFGIQEDGTVDDTVKEVIKGGPVYKDGYLTMEDKPGIGCDIDEEAAKRYPYKRAYIPVCRRPGDNSLCDW